MFLKRQKMLLEAIQGIEMLVILAGLIEIGCCCQDSDDNPWPERDRCPFSY